MHRIQGATRPRIYLPKRKLASAKSNSASTSRNTAVTIDVLANDLGGQTYPLIIHSHGYGGSRLTAPTWTDNPGVYRVATTGGMPVRVAMIEAVPSASPATYTVGSNWITPASSSRIVTITRAPVIPAAGLVIVEKARQRMPRALLLTLYLAGTDLYAHHASAHPDDARRAYLREVVDPKMGKLRRALEARGFFEDAYTMVLSDHGEVLWYSARPNVARDLKVVRYRGRRDTLVPIRT